MRYILDTDLLSILQQKRQPECDRLTAHLEEHPNEPICTTVVNFQEQALGWAAYLNRARKPSDILKAYRELLLIESYYPTSKSYRSMPPRKPILSGFRRRKSVSRRLTSGSPASP
jgi:hypothetical protein